MFKVSKMQTHPECIFCWKLYILFWWFWITTLL